MPFGKGKKCTYKTKTLLEQILYSFSKYMKLQILILLEAQRFFHICIYLLIWNGTSVMISQEHIFQLVFSKAAVHQQTLCKSMSVSEVAIIYNLQYLTAIVYDEYNPF